MIFSNSLINGVKIITPNIHQDKRGSFRRHFCQKELKKNKINFIVRQANVSENNTLHTLRGFHYQKEPYGEKKIISPVLGKIYNVVVDLRKKSKSYLKWEAFILSANEKKSILVPKGCANAYLTLSKNTIIHYYMSEFYNPKSYTGFRYDDPMFNIKWPTNPKLISDQDRSYKKLILDK